MNKISKLLVKFGQDEQIISYRVDPFLLGILYAGADCESSDQPAHPRSLIRVVIVC